jgi:hypothetical protein
MVLDLKVVAGTEADLSVVGTEVDMAVAHTDHSDLTSLE